MGTKFASVLATRCKVSLSGFGALPEGRRTRFSTESEVLKPFTLSGRFRTFSQRAGGKTLKLWLRVNSLCWPQLHRGWTSRGPRCPDRRWCRLDRQTALDEPPLAADLRLARWTGGRACPPRSRISLQIRNDQIYAPYGSRFERPPASGAPYGRAAPSTNVASG